MDQTPHVRNVATAELEDTGPLAEATGPEMTTRGLDVWVDGAVSGGIWECTAGPSYWVQQEHEVIHLVAGRMTVTRDGGEPVELAAGDMAVFPKGWSGTWDIHETVRKVYAIF
ncbi:MAG: cupin domain-containing protein [Nocardioides sp.]